MVFDDKYFRERGWAEANARQGLSADYGSQGAIDGQANVRNQASASSGFGSNSFEGSYVSIPTHTNSFSGNKAYGCNSPSPVVNVTQSSSAKKPPMPEPVMTLNHIRYTGGYGGEESILEHVRSIITAPFRWTFKIISLLVAVVTAPFRWTYALGCFLGNAIVALFWGTLKVLRIVFIVVVLVGGFILAVRAINEFVLKSDSNSQSETRSPDAVETLGSSSSSPSP